jgi:hypothetical protein
MSNDPVAAAAGKSLMHRITEGVGIVRERTIEIGARVIWVDNIGSLVILHGQRNYAMAIVGGLLLLAGLLIVSDNAGMGLLLVVAGGGLIAWNLSQPINNGLSIGTTDGRSTLIVSDNTQFLNAALDLIREKIESGSITLQGTFDIGGTHVNTGGGGVAMGRGAEALGRDRQIERQAPVEPFAPVDSAAAPYGPAAPREAPAAPAAAEWSRPSYADTDYSAESRGGGGRIAVFVVAALVAVGVLGGGGYYWWTQEQARQLAEAQRIEWEAVARDDAHALRAYIDRAPEAHQQDAATALAQLDQERSQAAASADSITAYRRYLADFPNGQTAEYARQRIDALERLEAFTQSAPQLISPAEGAVFDHFPRATVLTWTPLDGAASYVVEVQMWDRFKQAWVEEPGATLVAIVLGSESYAFNFVGAQPGRWRVRGQDASGRQSAFSDWRTFQYRR